MAPSISITKIAEAAKSEIARFSSPLSVDDFVKKSQFTYYTKDALKAVSDKVACFAEKEGLSAHARSAVARKKAD